jgi:hypothetical protein
MKLVVIAGITIAVIALYSFFRRIAKRNAFVNAYRRELEKVLTDEKHQVKGRFD